ncbi:hypothetical protein CPB84DRAFT_1760958 [Gymnopilus junonius]|uniref:Sulphur transport domain-containing protein n=1 Tax=Gymnopilus junonius TaxID=109634 RepID=A0A9P5P108_GYMJU|nr:hypothetical protein CPB84DRAFT_1760958 [Gymnopilus junonius]
MSTPTPLRALVGGLGIPVAAHELLLLNGNVFGISGFIHRAVKGSIEGLAGVAGLVLGGVLVGALEKNGPENLSLSLPQVLLSGFLVGLGTKLANGCTSGHMICGISRLSVRSIVATATFFTAGVVTVQFLHNDLPAVGQVDWSLGAESFKLLALQAIPMSISTLLYFWNPKVQQKDDSNPPHNVSRIAAYLATAFQFALALRLSNLSEASRVLSFLVLPFHRGFDPSLALVAGGALSVGIVLYHFARGDERSRLGGKWAIPKGGKVDSRLLIGSTIFAGPGLVSFGRSLSSGGYALIPYAAWLGSMAVGGLLV